MAANKIGVIDIGSNTVLMVCGHVSDEGRLVIDLTAHEVARLSEGLRDREKLQTKPKERVWQILENFQSLARDQGVTRLIAAGTAAFRRASDGENFAKEIQQKLGIQTRILRGDEEANLSYLSAQFDFGTENPSLGMIDIGGGSTEIVYGAGKVWQSMPVGTVRLVEKHVTSHPVSDLEWDNTRNEIRKILSDFLPKPRNLPDTWVAVAATPTALASVLQGVDPYDPEKVHGFEIGIQELGDLVENLRTSSLEERNIMKGMDPKRSELLPLGGAILLETMRFLNIEEVLASDHGLRYGLLWEKLCSK